MAEGYAAKDPALAPLQQTPSKPTLASSKGPSKRKWSTSGHVTAADTPKLKRNRFVSSRKRRYQLPHRKNPLRTGCKAHPKSGELVTSCCRNALLIREYPLFSSLFYLALQNFSFIQNYLSYSFCQSCCFVYACVSECVFIFCACEDTTPFKFGGVVLSYSVLWSALHVLWCCLLSEAMLSTACVWIWKSNEDKLSVTQYVWECPIGIVIDGGWNSIPTLRLWLRFMRMLLQNQENAKSRKYLKFEGNFCVKLCLFCNKVCSNGLSGWVTRVEYAPHIQTWVKRRQELWALL